MTDIMKTFGSKVFNDEVMKARLSKATYQELNKTIKRGFYLNKDIAEEVAKAMKDWAIENGATHFTHWFLPLSGATAEKHESFVSAAGGGKITLEFSPSNLVRGEADASSFPSGGLRDTFEARGYTAWDPTSYAFIKDGVLYIPTIFCGYNGEALDHKTPLLRSMEALNTQAMRILRVFGNEDVDHVKATAGAEQEYFLVDKKYFDEREDLKLTGRTLFGAMPPKGQEMNDHYYGSIKTRVQEFMKDLNEELWTLGIQAKTEHNEVAPSQHELACIYTKVNVTTDQNQLVMEMIKKVAERHGFVALLHEKPFEGVNGSGKHNNWSLSTDKGVNLMAPGDTPHDNAQFLLFLCAVIRAVDEYQDLLRISVASASNDHRLGANEAPPAVISIFLGDELTAVLESIEQDSPYEKSEDVLMKLGTGVLPGFSRDNTDRNRTSPFAFTGNKFEFRMPGSMSSLAFPNVIINTAVADSLEYFADRLEGSSDISRDIYSLVRETLSGHGRIIFNGDGYKDEWVREAERRGLSNYRTTADCVPHLLDKKNVDMLLHHEVFSRSELESRCEIMLETYCKTICIEARTMRSMAVKRIAPAIEKYTAELAANAAAKKAVIPDLGCRFEEETIRFLSGQTDRIYDDVDRLEEVMASLSFADYVHDSEVIRDSLLPAMEALRKDSDDAEARTSKSYWPLPNYGLLLFGEK